MLTETNVAGEEGNGGEVKGILVCDDNRMILKFMGNALEDLGYKAFMAESPEVAVKIAQMEMDGIALHVLDIDLPGVDGRVLHQLLKECNPEAKCILISGYSRAYIEDSGPIPAGIGFIQKPFGYGAFANEIRKAFDLLGDVPMKCSKGVA